MEHSHRHLLIWIWKIKRCLLNTDYVPHQRNSCQYLDIPKSKIRVIEATYWRRLPEQSRQLTEVYPAIVTMNRKISKTCLHERGIPRLPLYAAS